MNSSTWTTVLWEEESHSKVPLSTNPTCHYHKWINVKERLRKGSFNNYVGKKMGEGVSRKSTLTWHRVGTKYHVRCLQLSTWSGEGVKIGWNMVIVVVEWPLIMNISGPSEPMGWNCPPPLNVLTLIWLYISGYEQTQLRSTSILMVVGFGISMISQATVGKKFWIKTWEICLDTINVSKVIRLPRESCLENWISCLYWSV